MKSFLYLILIVVASSLANQDFSQEWQQYKAKFEKNYRSSDDEARKRIFVETHIKILEHNSNGNSSFTMDHNQFSDMTERERVKMLGTDRSLSDSASNREFTFLPEIEERQLPATLDYRTDVCLAPVKNQGSCGSCWAFTSIAPLEFSKCKKTGNTPILLSEQQLVDCSTQNNGCNGGWYTTAWNYLKSGSAKSASYAYKAVKSTCQFTAAMSAAKVASFGSVASKNPTAMQNALQKYGPLAVAINVVSSFYNYRSGVYSDSTCTGTKGDVNHGVVVVGYGTQNNENYWVVRNSWGSNWGAKGYILMKRGVNMCNIESYPAYVESA